jgi:hypothetical protein
MNDRDGGIILPSIVCGYAWMLRLALQDHGRDDAERK